MYKIIKHWKTTLHTYEAVEGEPIEHKIERIISNKEPLKDGAPIIHTLRSEGVKSAYNIRTDRFEVACEAMDTVTKTEITKRMNRIKEREVIKLQVDGIAEPTRGTSET